MCGGCCCCASGAGGVSSGLVPTACWSVVAVVGDGTVVVFVLFIVVFRRWLHEEGAQLPQYVDGYEHRHECERV